MATAARRCSCRSSNQLVPAAIETHDLSRVFDGVRAVDRVTLAVPGGMIFGLLGSNGAGKSTLIKMLTTLLPPTSGSARVAGHDVVRAAQLVRARIGYGVKKLARDPMASPALRLISPSRCE